MFVVLSLRATIPFVCNLSLWLVCFAAGAPDWAWLVILKRDPNDRPGPSIIGGAEQRGHGKHIVTSLVRARWGGGVWSGLLTTVRLIYLFFFHGRRNKYLASIGNHCISIQYMYTNLFLFIYFAFSHDPYICRNNSHELWMMLVQSGQLISKSAMPTRLLTNT